MYGYFGKALMSLKSFDFIYVHFLYTIVFFRAARNKGVRRKQIQLKRTRCNNVYNADSPDRATT